MPDRLSSEVLVFKALCVLDGAISDCAKAPLVPPLPGLRLALAYLYSVSNGELGICSTDREVFDQFWTAVMQTENCPGFGRDTMRSTMAGTYFAGICRRVGVSQTIAFGEALGNAARSADRSQLATGVRLSANEKIMMRVRRFEAGNSIDRPGRKR